MISVSIEQQGRFDKILPNESFEKVSYVDICLLKPKTDIINYMLDNSLVLNTIIDDDSTVNLRKPFMNASGLYRMGDNKYCNDSVGHHTIGLIIHDKKKVMKLMAQANKFIVSILDLYNMKPIIGDTIQLLKTENPNDETFLYVDHQYCIDVIFRYFKNVYKLNK